MDANTGWPDFGSREGCQCTEKVFSACGVCDTLILSQAVPAKLTLLRHRDVFPQSDYVPFTIFYLMPKYAPLMSMTFYLHAHKQVHSV